MWSNEDEPNEWATITAVVLRAAAILDSDSMALLEVNLEGGGDVPLAYWRKVRQEVWVWDLAHRSEIEARPASSWPRPEVVDAVRSDPLSADCVVVPGPTFASLGFPSLQTGSSIASPSRLVTVYDCGLDGVQAYAFSDQDKHSAAGKEAHARVIEAASRAEDGNKAAGLARAGSMKRLPGLS